MMALDQAKLPETFSILFVCTGNICRSPLAEYLLKRKIVDLHEVTVSSAGTHALVGAPMDEQTSGIASVLGVNDTANHRARQLNEKLLESSELVLTMTRDHRREAVGLSPRVTKKTFTLREFARLADTEEKESKARGRTLGAGTGRDKLREAVKIIPEYRGVLAALENPTDYDVIDPYRKNEGVHIESTNQITPAVDSVERWIRRQLGNGL
ncbi:arsenate reductase/protein-tyrosine-phosphatase family protein [Corynebacterium sp. S7]